MKLQEIHIKGYKSIDGQIGQTIPLGDITVLLGANGSGKSNLVSFFSMLNYMTTGAFQQYVGRQGASRLLSSMVQSRLNPYHLNFSLNLIKYAILMK